MSGQIDWLNRLCKWRAILAGWQLGSRVKGDPEGDAVRDHREATLILRAEVSALTALLIGKNFITYEEWAQAVLDEARVLCEAYEKRFPGITAVDNGMEIDARGMEIMKGWRP